MNARQKKWVWAGGAVVTLGLALTLVTMRLDAILNRQKQKLLPQLTELLGRPVSLGHVSTTWLSGFGAEVQHAAIGADPNEPDEKDPLLEVGSVRIEIKLWPLITSFGKRTLVDEVILEGLSIHVVRYPDGTLNVDRLAERIASKKQDDTPKPMDDETRAYIRGLHVRRIALRNARLRFVDAARGRAVAEVSKLNFEVRDLSVHRPFTAKLDAAVLTAQPNLKLEARFGKTENLEVGPPLLSAKIALEKTNLSPLAPFLESRIPGLMTLTAEANVDASLGAASPGGSGPTMVKSHIACTGVRFKEGSSAFEGRVEVDLEADVARGDVQLKQFRGSVDDMSLTGQGKLLALRSAPRFENFAVESEGLHFDRIRALYPSLDRSVGAALRGPFGFRIRASGDRQSQSFVASVDLTGASIRKESTFAKPAGVALRLAASGDVNDQLLTLRQLSLQLADLELKGQGTVRNFNSPSFQFTANANASDITGLVRLSPKVAESLPSAQRVQGTLSVAANAQGSSRATRAQVQASLSGANLKLPDMELVGSAQMNVQTHLQSTSDECTTTQSSLQANLTSLAIRYEDQFSKRAGVPMTARMQSQSACAKNAVQGPSASSTFDVTLASMQVTGKALTVGEERPTFDAQVRVANFDTAQMRPFLTALADASVRPMRVSGEFHARGRQGHPETTNLEVRNLNVRAGQSDIAGALKLRNLLQPVFELNARSNYLDLNDFVGESKANDEDSDRSMLTKAQGTATLTVKKGTAARLSYENLQCELALKHGRATAKTMTVQALGGTFSGSGTELDLVDEHGPFHVVGGVERMSLNDTTGYLMSITGALLGNFSGKVDLRGRGTSLADMREHLDGRAQGELAEVSLETTHLADSLVRPLESKLSFLKGHNLTPPAKLASPSIKKLATTLVVKNGALEWTRPLQAMSSLGPVTLTGKTFLTGKLDMKGSLRMPPELATQLIGGTAKVQQEIPVQLAIGGTLTKPSIRPTELDTVAKTYMMAYAKTAAASKLGSEANKLLKNTGLDKTLTKMGPVPTSQAEAEAAAKKAAEQARAQAEAQAREQAAKLQAEQMARAEAARRQAEEKARAEAEKAQKAAEEKLQQQGKEKLRGLFGK
jgi:hypothetical protein